MRVGLDYRTVGTSPQSGISRQVYALESALHTLPNIEVERFTVAPLGDETRLSGPIARLGAAPRLPCTSHRIACVSRRVSCRGPCANTMSICTSAPSIWACRCHPSLKDCAPSCCCMICFRSP